MKIPNITPSWPPGSVSLNGMAERVIGDTAESDATNVKTRVWRSSKPVIHLAAAVAIAMSYGEAAGHSMSMLDFLHTASVLRWTIGTAQHFAAILARQTRLRIDQADLIDISAT